MAEAPDPAVPTASTTLVPAVGHVVHSRQLLRRLVVAAWLAILLGVAMQLLVLGAKLALGSLPSGARIALDMVQGVTWSFLVCAGVSLGTAIGKARHTLGGLVALVSAPLALGLARGGQKALASALQAADHPALLSLGALGAIRAVEYGLLGWLWRGWRPAARRVRQVISPPAPRSAPASAEQ